MSEETELPRPHNVIRGSHHGTKERRAFVAKYVIAGYSAPQIALMWNNHVTGRNEESRRVTAECIKVDRRRILQEITEQHTQELRHYRGLLIERLELVIESLHPMVRKGNLGAIDRYLKTIQQIGDVTGANAPIKLEVENVTTLSQEERQRRVLEIIDRARMRNVIDGEAEEVIDLPLLPGEESHDGDE